MSAKIKIFIYLLVTNTVLSLQAVTIINYTLGVMNINKFGNETEQGDLIDEEVLAKLFFREALNTTGSWGKSYDFITVSLYGKFYNFRNLRPETLIVFEDKENYEVSYQRFESLDFMQKLYPLVIINNTKTEITLSDFAGEIKDYVNRQQIQRKPVVLGPGDRIELNDNDCILDRMHITGKDYYLTNGIFRDLNELASFPSAYFPALAYTTSLIFYMNNYKMIEHKRSKDKISSNIKDPLIIINLTNQEVILSDFRSKKVKRFRLKILRHPIALAPGDRIEICDENCKIEKLKINGIPFSSQERYLEILNK